MNKSISYIVGEFPHSMGMGSLSVDTVIKLCYTGGLGRPPGDKRCNEICKVREK